MIGVFSGTFDPVHEGHILFALTAIDQFQLKKVYFAPEHEPWRKNPQASYKQRKAMLEIAVAQYEYLDILELSSRQHDVIETWPEIKNRFQPDSIAFIMGADVFEQLNQWQDWQQLQQSCAFIVGLRTEDDGEIVLPLAAELQVEAQFLPSPLASVSSSAIRQAIATSAQPKGLNDEIEKFITFNKLYN